MVEVLVLVLVNMSEMFMKKLSAVMLILVMLVGSALADDPNQALFDKANEEFKIASEAGDNKPEVAKAAYLRAADIFAQVIRSGVKNGDIYYNLGNCYYQAGDFPLAILQYRRALLYAPEDEKIHSNLASAERMLDSTDPKENTRGFWETIASYNAKIPLIVKEYFNKISYVLFWGGLIGFLTLRKKVARKKFIIIAIIWWLSLVGVSLVSYLAAGNADGIILSSEVTARKGDGDNYAEAFLKPLPAGTEFTVLETRGDWLKVELTTGNKCWLKTSDVGLVKDEP